MDNISLRRHRSAHGHIDRAEHRDIGGDPEPFGAGPGSGDDLVRLAGNDHRLELIGLTVTARS